MTRNHAKKSSDLTDKRETIHESSVRALRAAQEAIETLERELAIVERERDGWRNRALKCEEETNDTH